jgi:hypothetical protein
MMKTTINRWLQNDIFFTLWASVAAFSTYFCMYAFRKPFTAGTYEGLAVWGMDLKIVLVIAQVLGYMLSKFMGIKIISEMTHNNRPLSILTLIGVSWLALLMFSIVPTAWKPICLFLNGFPLGLIWGIVFSYLEGRRMTEALGAGLAVNFILASGMVKSAGKIATDSYGFSEFQMPFVVGGFFVIPLLISVWLLAQIPAPSLSDQALRSKRQPMNGEQRIYLFKKYGLGIVCLLVFHFVLTAFRDFRDNFIVELWQSLGYKDNAAILTSAEITIAICVLILVAFMVFIKNNALAFWLIHALILIGGFTILLSTYFFENGRISPVNWMIMIGFGLYLSYILFQVLIFERMMATFREVGNVGFLMYVADATGYLGSIAVMFYKNFSSQNLSWLDFFTQSSYIVGITCLVLVSASWAYFYQQYAAHSTTAKMVLE